MLQLHAAAVTIAVFLAVARRAPRGAEVTRRAALRVRGRYAGRAACTGAAVLGTVVVTLPGAAAQPRAVEHGYV
ncbi:hypothetical protein, partial [Streptomyces clavuligerus]